MTASPAAGKLPRVNLLRRSAKTNDADEGVSMSKGAPAQAGAAAAADATVAAKQVGKGRPTPKRSEAEGRRRGPVAPPPKTQREAIKRSRAGTKSLSKDERRALSAERREKMARGDQAFLMTRDKGDIRAFVRDQVDLRRNFAGLLMPMAIISFIILLIPNAYLQTFGPLVLLVLILAAVADTTVLGSRLAKQVRAEFPNGDGTTLSRTGRALGFYAFNRAIMPRRWRVPKPRVKR